MTDKKKQIRYGENYDVFSHLSNAQKEDGKPAYEVYQLDGVLQTYDSPDGKGRFLYVPVYTIDGNTMKDWFHTVFKDGRVETIRHTAPAVYDQDRKIWVEPPEVVEVRLYKNMDDEHYLANGFAKVQIVEGSKYPELPSAATMAFKNAMSNAGFGVDIDWETVYKNAPKFFHVTESDEPALYVPVNTTSPGTKAVEFDESAHEIPMARTEEKTVKESVLEGQTSLDLSDPLLAALSSSGKEHSISEEELAGTKGPTAASETEEKAEVLGTKMTKEDALDTVFFAVNKQNMLIYNNKTFRENLEQYPEDFRSLIEMIALKQDIYKRWIANDVLEAAEALTA